MKKVFIAIILFINIACSFAQATFNTGWKDYKTGAITHEYVYSCKDNLSLYLNDSIDIFFSPDSLIKMTVEYPLSEHAVYKTVEYFNTAKELIKREEYKSAAMLQTTEWKYDDKKRKVYQYEDNKQNGNKYKKTYTYEPDKKTGGRVVTESSYFNDKIEYYTKDYYDDKNVKTKQVRLNDNNEDIMHVESYIYDDKGKLKERSVYFPEFKVTKTFPENVDDPELPKCSRVLPITNETITYPLLPSKVAFLKKFLTKEQVILTDKDCKAFEYKFTNRDNCDIIVSSTKVNNSKRVLLRLKQKMG